MRLFAQELGGARCDALAKHLEVNRAEKAALAARCDELAADVAALHDDVAAAERRCESAEASVDAIAKASVQDPNFKEGDMISYFLIVIVRVFPMRPSIILVKGLQST